MGGEATASASRTPASARSTWLRSVSPWAPDGVPTQTRHTSACSIASTTCVVARSRPEATPSAISSFSPGSTMQL